MTLIMDNILKISVHVGRGVYQEVEGDELELCREYLVGNDEREPEEYLLTRVLGVEVGHVRIERVQ